MTSTWQAKCREILRLGERGVRSPICCSVGDGGRSNAGGKIRMKISVSTQSSNNIDTHSQNRGVKKER